MFLWRAAEGRLNTILLHESKVQPLENMHAGSDVYRAYGESTLGSYLQLRIRFQSFSAVALWPAFGGHRILVYI